jgi:hypothetical protein
MAVHATNTVKREIMCAFQAAQVFSQLLPQRAVPHLR